MENEYPILMKHYFDQLNNYFGNLAEQVKKHGVSAGQIASDYLSDSGRRQRFQSNLPEFCRFILDFWKKYNELINSEIVALPGFKVRFGGDIGPQVSDAVFERVGLYFETILVPDPLLRVARLPDVISKNKDYYFLKYSILNILFMEVYRANIYPPIAMLTGDIEFEENNVQKHSEIALYDCVLITNDLYDKDFQIYKDVEEFYDRFKGPEEAIKEAKKPELLYWSDTASSDPFEQWNDNYRALVKDLNAEEQTETFQGINPLLFSIRSRMLQANMVMFGASYHKAAPLMAAPVSFHWMNWKIRVNRNMITKELGANSNLDIPLTNALLSRELKWLSNVPIESVIELRKKGKLSELRSIINKETERFANSPFNEIETIAHQVDFNLTTALNQHQDEVEQLDKKYRTELSVLGPTFLLSVAGAFQTILSPVTPEWITALSRIIGTGSYAEITRATIEYFRQRKTLGSTPFGILWKAKKQNK
jgi:hypothetical protein